MKAHKDISLHLIRAKKSVKSTKEILQENGAAEKIQFQLRKSHAIIAPQKA
jgi:hypothetical protein